MYQTLSPARIKHGSRGAKGTRCPGPRNVAPLVVAVALAFVALATSQVMLPNQKCTVSMHVHVYLPVHMAVCHASCCV